MTLAPGSTFGRFRVLRRLGAGAMGEVYLAEDPRIERRLAIKTVRVATDEPAIEEELRARLAREAKAAGQLVHAHVVTLFDAGEIDGCFYLAFEYVEGSDLAARMLRPPPLTVRDVLRIGRETASGLAAAHRRGIVHRDIKPANLLLSVEGAVKISDFGIAKLTGAGTELTQLGSLIGTPQYLSPEQVRGETLDGRSDLFSLGVVLYELLAGQCPFTGDTLSTLVFQILSREPRPLHEIAPYVPRRLADGVMRLLAKERDARFASAEVLAEELKEIEREYELRDHGATLVRPGGTPPPEPVQAAAALEATILADDRRARPAPRTVAATAVAAERTRWWHHSTRRRTAFLAASLALPLLVLGLAVAGLRHRSAGGTGEAREPATISTTTEAEHERARSSVEADNAAASVRRPEATPRRDQEAPEEPVSSREELATPPSRAEGSPRRLVGGTVTFTIAPPEAARRAVVTVDGVVRGPAHGSLVTLRPGGHQVEVIAEGFELVTLLVDSRPGAAGPTRLELVMESK